MNRREQGRFVNELGARIVSEMVARIKAGDVPAEWDGHELRRWLADRAEQSASGTDCYHARGRARRRERDYENEVLTRNL